MKLFHVLVEALNSKERTAKVYSSTLRRVYRDVYGKELEVNDLNFIDSVKVFNYLKKIVNLTKQKNTATALLMFSKAKKSSEKIQNKFRKVMMDADKNYQSFLASGKRKRPFENAEKTWEMVTELYKKPKKEIEARSLFELGSQVSPLEYKILIAWVYLKFIAHLPPRRLEYTDTRVISKKDFENIEKKEDNYIVMGNRQWKWHLFKFKTVDKFGPQILKIPGPLKKALNKMKPIIFSKNANGFIFLTNKWKPMTRSQFSAFVKWVFKTYSGKNWSQNTIRSIKVSSIWSPDKNPLKLAKEMGHSIQTAVLHYKA